MHTTLTIRLLRLLLLLHSDTYHTYYTYHTYHTYHTHPTYHTYHTHHTHRTHYGRWGTEDNTFVRIFGTRTRRQLQAINEAYTATCAATLPIYHPTRHTPRHVRPLATELILLQPPHTRSTAFGSRCGVT